MASVKVAVRVRPLNERENSMESDVIIAMKGKSTLITNNKISKQYDKGQAEMGRERVKTFSYDYSYWSVDETDSHYTPQKQVFKDLGTDVITSAYEGYNACVFAYGQTGSGKTHTMMGNSNDPGMIPRICEGLFAKMKMTDSITYRTEVSYLEIYNERVRDLLRLAKSEDQQHTLRVREHPKDGPYVQDLSNHLVSTYDDIADLMNRGNMNRTTAATNMNDSSSRSHAIFTLVFTQAKFHKNLPSETRSKIHLVDLAGSERADATGATGQRLKEGASINKSLVTLGNVISILADLADSSRSKRQVFIPYRDSVLTWLLKDSLGGNAKTIMIATISPACVNYAETLSTLRYANRAKNIVNKPTVNEDPNVRLIRELRAEISRLKMMLGGNIDKVSTPRMQEKLCENEARVKILTDEWTGRWKEAHCILEEERMALRKEGLGVVLDSELPHLIGIDDDILSTGIMLYHLKAGKTTVGTENAVLKQDIELGGLEVEDEHCEFVNDDGVVWLYPRENSLCMVNGILTSEPVRLNQGSVILLGRTNMFRFNHPTEAAQLRKDRALGSNLNSSRWSLMSQSMSDLARSTESLSTTGISMDMEERHQKQLEDLERKRCEILDMEQRYADAERIRCLEQENREREIEEKRLILERMQSEADAMKQEAETIQTQIKTEEVKLRKKSRDIEKRLQDHLIEKEEFEAAKEKEITMMKLDKEREYEQIKNERRKLENEKVQHVKAVQEAKDELTKEVERIEAERQKDKDTLERDWRRLEEKEHQYSENARLTEQEITNKRLQLQRQRDEGLDILEQERLELVELSVEKAQLYLDSPVDLNGVDEMTREREHLNKREMRLVQQFNDERRCLQTKHETEMDVLKQEKANVKRQWDKINNRGETLQKRLENGDCSANVEKEELEFLEKEVALLQDAEDELSIKERECEISLANELKTLESDHCAELEEINIEKQELLAREKLTLNHVERGILEKARHLEDKKRRLSEDERMLLELEERQLQAMREAEDRRLQLENERKRLAEIAQKQEQEAEMAKAELHRRRSTLDDLAKQEIDRIGEQMRRLSTWDGLHTVPEYAHSAGSSSDCSDPLDGTREEELEKLEKRMEALKIIEDQFRRSEHELEAKRHKFADERQEELDRIEIEKCKLEELENQKRINTLVEEAVKKRLLEERAVRDQKFQEERDKERKDRQAEITRMKRDHDHELQRLRQKYELPDFTPTAKPIHSSKSNPYASPMNCDARPHKEYLRKKYQTRSKSLSALPTVNHRLPRIQIVGFIIRGYGVDVHCEYEVKIVAGDDQWSVCRRYRRFRELHQHMKALYPDICALAFPPKKYFGSRSTKVVQERRILLEGYLQHLLEICARSSHCPLNYAQNKLIDKHVLHQFSAFFKIGVFETSKHGSA